MALGPAPSPGLAWGTPLPRLSRNLSSNALGFRISTAFLACAIAPSSPLSISSGVFWQPSQMHSWVEQRTDAAKHWQ